MNRPIDLLGDENDPSLSSLDNYIDDFVEGNSDLLEESSPVENEDKMCSLCNETYSDPRVLSCLHAFCKVCLENLLVDGTGDNLKINKIIVCPKCKQDTVVGDKGVALESKACNFLLMDIAVAPANKTAVQLCTSCKTEEPAWSHCVECSNFLCLNCNMAHQFMRCFQEHTVVQLNPKEGNPLPPCCEKHDSQVVMFYCFTCQSLICKTCTLTDHSATEHNFERIPEAESSARGHLANLLNESKAKVHFYEEVSSNLENGLSELQSQQDNAKDLINETFQSYKAILEKHRDEQLSELKRLHAERELKIMESFHNVEQNLEKIEDACKFAGRLLEKGTPVEILGLKYTVELQLLNLINNTPKTDVNVVLDFETDIVKFETAIKETFGSFRSDVAIPKDAPSPVIPDRISPVTNSSSPVSLPTSMQSSFEGDLATGFTLPPPPVSPTNLHNLTTIQEYNLQQLANLAVKEEVVLPASTAPSPTPSFTLADLFCGDVGSANNALNNLQALAQLNNVTLDEAARVLVNGDRRFHTPTPSPPPNMQTNMPPTLNALINDFSNGRAPTMGHPNMILGRGESVNTLEISTPFPMNLSNLSGTPSPNLSDEVMNDGSLLNLSTGVSTNGGTHSYQFRGSAGKLNPMQIRCKYGQLGPSKGQFNSPHGFCLGADEDIIVADTNNHRIQVFDKVGTFKFQFGIPGKEEGQLWYPRKVAVMRTSGKFVVCDRGNERSRMQIFTKNGHFVKKIAIRYVDIVAGLAVTHQGHIVAVDSVSPTVFVISEAGDLIRWFDCSDYMREPSDIAINGREFFVCDFKGHCVVVFNEEGHFMRRIGNENITNFPNGIDISDAGDVLVGDSHGNRFHVAVFTREGQLLSEFECPYVKVSRCCGLKITSEGFVVTLAKNNHHVLVLNTLYIV